MKSKWKIIVFTGYKHAHALGPLSFDTRDELHTSCYDDEDLACTQCSQVVARIPVTQMCTCGVKAVKLLDDLNHLSMPNCAQLVLPIFCRLNELFLELCLQRVFRRHRSVAKPAKICSVLPKPKKQCNTIHVTTVNEKPKPAKI